MNEPVITTGNVVMIILGGLVVQNKKYTGGLKG